MVDSSQNISQVGCKADAEPVNVDDQRLKTGEGQRDALLLSGAVLAVTVNGGQNSGRISIRNEKQVM